MKNLISISLLLTLVFSCKKAEVRKGIQGDWILISFETTLRNPTEFNGTGTVIYNFGNCSRKMNKEETCILTVNGNEEYPYQIINRGKEIKWANSTTSFINLNEDKMVFTRSSSKLTPWRTFIRK